MRVLFKLRPNKRDRQADAVIYCRIKVDGRMANDFSTSIKVARKEWDQPRQRILGNSNRAFEDNLRLEQIRSDITRRYLQDSEVGAQELADLQTRKKQAVYFLSDLVDLYEQDCQLTYDNDGTLRSYTTRISNIRQFIKDRKLQQLKAERMGISLGDDFVRWMKQRGLDHQYIVRHTQVLKGITSGAVRREILKVDPLQSFKLKKREKLNLDHLTPEELRTLEQMEWRAPLQRIVDLFVFSCYTGLHYSDVQTLVPEEVQLGPDGRLWLFKPRGKYAESQFFDESVQLVPLHPKALILIEKYGGVDRLPKISDSNYNDYLKQIQYLAGIKVHLTVKVGRKTFTDYLLNELNVSQETVAAMLGHKSTDTVRYYAKVDQRRIAKEVKY